MTSDEEDQDIDKVVTPEHLFHVSDYKLLTAESVQQPLLFKDQCLSVVSAKKLVASVAPTLMECVLLIENHWFLITGYSVFLHHPSRLDDCADNSHFQYQANPVACCIERKIAFGKESFELSIKVGYIELLANAGFFGPVDSVAMTPFAGSALQNLPQQVMENYHAKTQRIFTKEKVPSHSRRNRIVNQYFKEMSKVNWQLDSRRFNDVSPCNPIMFITKHPWQEAASFILRCYTYKELDGRRTNKLIKMLDSLDRPQHAKISHQLIHKHLLSFQKNRKAPKKLFTLNKKNSAKVKGDLIDISRWP